MSTTRHFVVVLLLIGLCAVQPFVLTAGESADSVAGYGDGYECGPSHVELRWSGEDAIFSFVEPQNYVSIDVQAEKVTLLQRRIDADGRTRYYYTPVISPDGFQWNYSYSPASIVRAIIYKPQGKITARVGIN